MNIEPDWQQTATPIMCWFAQWKGGDWFCVLYRLPNGNARVEYRFRDAAKPGKEEQKRWYVAESDIDGERGVVEMRETTRAIASGGALPTSKVEEVEILDGDVLEALREKPWAHVMPTAAGVGEA